MFDRVGDLAERVANHVSRRAFLGRLGQGALGVAAAIGGVLAFPANARADNLCCLYVTLGGRWCSGHPKQGVCPAGPIVDCKTCPSGGGKTQGG